jgi:hypothetical protein
MLGVAVVYVVVVAVHAAVVGRCRLTLSNPL